MQDAGSMILEQQPMKTAEAIILFLQGQGHFPALSILQRSQKRARAVKSQAEIFGKKNILFLDFENFGKTIYLNFGIDFSTLSTFPSTLSLITGIFRARAAISASRLISQNQIKIF